MPSVAHSSDLQALRVLKAVESGVSSIAPLQMVWPDTNKSLTEAPANKAG